MITLNSCMHRETINLTHFLPPHDLGVDIHPWAVTQANECQMNALLPILAKFGQ